jgi:anthranilate phosphoribosyltransferase
LTDVGTTPELRDLLAELGTARALVFYGHDGLDELTVTTTSTVHELRDHIRSGTRSGGKAVSVEPSLSGIGSPRSRLRVVYRTPEAILPRWREL